MHSTTLGREQRLAGDRAEGTVERGSVVGRTSEKSSQMVGFRQSLLGTEQALEQGLPGRGDSRCIPGLQTGECQGWVTQEQGGGRMARAALTG